MIDECLLVTINRFPQSDNFFFFFFFFSFFFYYYNNIANVNSKEVLTFKFSDQDVINYIKNMNLDLGSLQIHVPSVLL